MTDERDLTRRLAEVQAIAAKDQDIRLKQEEELAEAEREKVELINRYDKVVVDLNSQVADAEQRLEEAAEAARANSLAHELAEERAEKALHERDELRALYNVPGGVMEQVEAKNAELRAALGDVLGDIDHKEDCSVWSDDNHNEDKNDCGCPKDAPLGTCSLCDCGLEKAEHALKSDGKAPERMAQTPWWRRVLNQNTKQQAALVAIRDDPGNTNDEGSTDVLVRHIQRAEDALKSDG